MSTRIIAILLVYATYILLVLDYHTTGLPDDTRENYFTDISLATYINQYQRNQTI